MRPPASQPGGASLPPSPTPPWEHIVARRWSRYAPAGARPEHDPAVHAVADYCADAGRAHTDTEIDLLLARALRATGRHEESVRAAAGAATLREPLDSRPGEPGLISLDLDRLEPAAACGELTVYRLLRAAVESALDAHDGQGPIALRGAARLARRVEGRRASRRRIRARCDDLRRYCATVAARHVGDDAPPPEVIFWAPME